MGIHTQGYASLYAHVSLGKGGSLLSEVCVQDCQLVRAKCGVTCMCLPQLNVCSSLVCLSAKESIFVPISSKKWISFRNKIKGTHTLQCQARKEL